MLNSSSLFKVTADFISFFYNSYTISLYVYIMYNIPTQVILFTSLIACGICPCTILQRIMCSRSTSLNVDNRPDFGVVALGGIITQNKLSLLILIIILMTMSLDHECSVKPLIKFLLEPVSFSVKPQDTFKFAEQWTFARNKLRSLAQIIALFPKQYVSVTISANKVYCLLYHVIFYAELFCHLLLLILRNHKLQKKLS